MNRLFAQAFLNQSDAGDTYLLRTGLPIVDKSRLMVGQLQHGLLIGDQLDLIYGVDVQLTRPDTEGTITGRNEALGTPTYMAPEQFRSAATVDRRADVWSVGVVLYEMVTGKRAFPGCAADVLTNVIEGRFTPLSTLVPELPPRMATAIDGCMKVDPARRYADAGAVLEAWCSFRD